MKVNWFSPLPPAETEIAHYSSRVAPALATHMELQIWTDQPDWDPSIERSVRVRHWDISNPPWSAFHEAEASIYNIGNNCTFHQKIWQLSSEMPGVVILHDTCLQHLFAGHFLSLRQDVWAYEESMARFYGLPGRNAARAYTAGGCSTESMAMLYPLTELATQDCLGVITHSRPAFQDLAAITPSPTLYVPLAYDASLKEIRDRWSDVRSRVSKPPYHLTIFGYLGPNRGLESIIGALGGHADREQFRLGIYGRVWDPELIKQTALRAGIEHLVELHGYVEDIDAALANSDIVLNLRYPSMGEASASQLRVWDHGLPSVVTRTAWYGSLPDDTVLFVRPEYEVEDIRSILSAYLSEPTLFTRIGKRGRAVLDQEHTTDGYAAAIAAFLPYAVEYRNIVAASRLAGRLGTDLSRWTTTEAGTLPGDRAAARIVSFVNSMASASVTPSCSRDRS